MLSLEIWEWWVKDLMASQLPPLTHMHYAICILRHVRIAAGQIHTCPPSSQTQTQFLLQLGHVLTGHRENGSVSYSVNLTPGSWWRD